MQDQQLQGALERFLASPGEEHLPDLLEASAPFVLAHARAWHASGMDLTDRCREILAEIFLILSEEFLATRVARPESVLAFLALRLRRLTRPKHQRAVPFGGPQDLPEIGRADFTPLRLELVQDIVGAVRQALATDPRPETRRLECLFIHVQPELAWASRFLARAEGAVAADDRLEADKKRHQAFNRGLRGRFERLASGDWRDILDWSPGERSHLAWRIIDLGGPEAQSLGEDPLRELHLWREEPSAQLEPPPETSVARLALIERVLASLTARFGLPSSGVAPASTPAPAQVPVTQVAEEAAPYGAPPAEDVLALLLGVGTPADAFRVREPRVPLRSETLRLEPAGIPAADVLTRRNSGILPSAGVTSAEEAIAFGEASAAVSAWWTRHLAGRCRHGAKPSAAGREGRFPPGGAN